LLFLLGLVLLQGWLTLRLFSPERPWQRLLDDQPILSGKHPLHLYHGLLGARSFLEHGTLCCYDPCFQAGYPKTPVFDSGSRPGELFLLVGGGAYRPAGYKVGLALCCLLVPLLLAAAARSMGLSRAASCLAAGLGLLVWWGPHGRGLLEAGDLDLLLAGLAAVTQAGLLIRFDRAPGAATWLGVLAAGWLGWFAHPLLFTLLLPLALVYYVSVGTRHGLAWHLALLAGLAGAVAANAHWLTDWVQYWWIRAPLAEAAPELSHRTLLTLWQAPVWGEATDRALALALFGTAAVGAALLNARGQRAAARLLGLGALGFTILSLAGAAWEPLGRLGSSRLLVPALLFALLPATHALAETFGLAGRWIGGAGRAAALTAVLLLAAGAMAYPQTLALAARWSAIPSLTIGLGPQQREVLAVVEKHTTPEARILWEEYPRAGNSRYWTALLPLLTDHPRLYVGGLDPDGSIDHARIGLVDQLLAGRPLREWSDEQLKGYCERYNVGWVVCWSPGAIARFRGWPGAVETATLHDQEPGYLFKLPRQPSFTLKGTAQLLRADCQRISLGDVVPDADGRVVLSLHYQSGLKASPGRVQVERHLVDPDDPIPLVRLRMPGPVARITLTWEGR
jgi:hypothetical protein